jgi:large conductance mechanosensitive channel
VIPIVKNGAILVGNEFHRTCSSAQHSQNRHLLVDDILVPPLGLLLGKVDFGSLFDVLDSSKGIPMSLQGAKAKVFRSLLTGNFINDIINFLIIAFVIFLLIRTINNMKKTTSRPLS